MDWVRARTGCISPAGTRGLGFFSFPCLNLAQPQQHIPIVDRGLHRPSKDAAVKAVIAPRLCQHGERGVQPHEVMLGIAPSQCRRRRTIATSQIDHKISDQRAHLLHKIQCRTQTHIAERGLAFRVPADLGHRDRLGLTCTRSAPSGEAESTRTAQTLPASFNLAQVSCGGGVFALSEKARGCKTPGPFVQQTGLSGLRFKPRLYRFGPRLGQ